MGQKSGNMSFTPFTKAACVDFLGSRLLAGPATGWAQGVGKLKAKAPPKEDKMPADLASEQVDSYLKKEIEQEAKKLEHERDVNAAKDPYFDYVEVLLQIAIVMASISIIATSPMLFYFALGTATIGTLLSINGFLLLVNVPFLS
jgi:hypothetical protein